MKYTMIALILFLLITSTWAGTLTDDFSDRNMNEWIAVGNWKIDNGELVMGPGDTGFAIGETTWQDYTVGVRIKIIEHQKVDDWISGALITARFVDFPNGYRFGIGTFGQSPRQAHAYRADNMVVMRIESKPFKWELNTWYDLKIAVEGEVLKHYVDDELFLEYIDDTYPAGQVGIFSTSAVIVHFDDFFVIGDDVPDLNLSVSPQGKIAKTWGKIKKP